MDGNNASVRLGSAGTGDRDAADQSQQGRLDEGKQVANNEVLSGADNAPTPVEGTMPTGFSATPDREAGMEVTDSWQTRARQESAPISMAHHESNSGREEAFMADVKGPPPSYDSLSPDDSQASSSGLTPLTSPTSIEPDQRSEMLPPRPEDKTAVSHLLAWIPQAPKSPQAPRSRLTQPMIIPQLDVPPSGEKNVPFQRSYSDALASYGVSAIDFLHFMDGLELAQAPSSALQGLRMFGVGVTHVPIPVLGLLTGKGITALASFGSGNTGTRARLYLEQVQERYFAPRGLRLAIVKDNDLNARVGVPTHTPRLAPLTQGTLSVSSCQRRLEAMTPYVAPLRYDVPAPEKPVQGVQRMARKHLSSRFKERSKKTEELRKQQWQGETLAAGSWDFKYANKLAEVRKAQLDLIHEPTGQARTGDEKGSAYREKVEALRLAQHELQLIISERQNHGRGTAAVQAEMEEVTWTRRLRWLVIEDAAESGGRMATASELGLAG